ncbi:hypothetical protein C8J56DRAFT_953045 [Mycena floridula]|nr:hypothetical protein C8J56DRAFT_953045 [Mycena floridula]
MTRAERRELKQSAKEKINEEDEDLMNLNRTVEEMNISDHTPPTPRPAPNMPQSPLGLGTSGMNSPPPLGMGSGTSNAGSGTGAVPGTGIPGMGSDLFSHDFVADQLEFAPWPDGDINFERDFGQWFSSDDGGMGSDLFSHDFINSVADQVDFDPSMFKPDGDINFERDFGQWFSQDDVPWDSGQWSNKGNPKRMPETCKSTYTSSPHLEPFLSSNEPPSQTQESQFRELLTEGVQELRDFDERIAAMRRDLEVLVTQRASKRREVEGYRSVLHPIRRLPKEILCEIFLSFVNEEIEDSEENSSLDPSSMIWILPQVSADWRSIVLSFPRMWSTVRLTDEDFDMDRLPNTIRMLEAQLHRSGSYELSLTIDSPVSLAINSSVDLSKSHLLFENLFSTSSRWKQLFIFTTVKSLETFAPLRGSLPSMTTLHLWVYGDEPLVSEVSMFEFAPKLTKLFGDPYMLQKLNLPFSQIVTYGQNRDDGFARDDGFTCTAYAALLSRMTNLEEIRTACLVDSEEDLFRGLDGNTVPTTVTFPSLSRVVLLRAEGEEGAEHNTDECSLVPRLTVPALKELEIEIHQSMDQLRALLRRSQCSLMTLSLKAYAVPDEACIDLLKVIPTLTSFTFESSEHLVTKFLETFSRSPSVVPALRSLKLENSGASRPELSVVENFQPTSTLT